MTESITISRVFYGQQLDVVPSQFDCECAADAWKQNREWVWHGYFGIVTKLMLAGFSLLLMASPAFGQSFTVEVVQPVQSFTVVVTEPDDDEFYAVMFTAKWCGPCQAYKTSGKLDRLMKRIATTVVDVDEQRQWGVSRVPTFWLCRRSTQTRVKSWTGTIDVDTIEREITRIRETKSGTITTTQTVSQSRNPSLFGRVGTSHESRQTLINHLANDGIHRGKWRLVDLQAMSDDALNNAHDQDHGW